VPSIGFRTLYLKKRFPLAISRGVIEGSENLFVSLTEDGVTGWGEMAPGGTEGAGTAAEGQAMLDRFWGDGPDPDWSIHRIDAEARAAGVAACALAALDMALWDLRAKQAGMPLSRLLGLGRRAVPTSVTIGINPPEVVRERVPLLLAAGAKALKIKLGSPAGVEADKAMFAAVIEAAAGSSAVLRVDANGGWTLPQARDMMAWLAARGVEYIEQPLKQGQEADLPALFRDRPLPIFVDESLRVSADVPALADRCDGVNLKLMKCGGITEALRIVAVARACGLQTMIGCMGESAISIAAGASLSELFDHIDLDSHLNLAPDPATGAPMTDGVVLPDAVPGHGGRLRDA
jgi:muconate cycloisomerase